MDLYSSNASSSNASCLVFSGVVAMPRKSDHPFHSPVFLYTKLGCAGNPSSNVMCSSFSHFFKMLCLFIRVLFFLLRSA